MYRFLIRGGSGNKPKRTETEQTAATITPKPKQIEKENETSKKGKRDFSDSESCGWRSNANTPCGSNEDINAANKRNAETNICNVENKVTCNEVESTEPQHTAGKITSNVVQSSKGEKTTKKVAPVTKKNSNCCNTKTVQVQNQTEVKSQSRRFKIEWLKTYPWLMCPDEKYEKIYCSPCTKFVDLKLPLPPMNTTLLNSKEAFVTNGFCAWSRAHDAFKSHENSQFHRYACSTLKSMKQAPVIQQISKQKEHCMIDARTALTKIFESILFLAREGIAFRGSYDKEDHAEHSKFTHLLQLRANDVPELKSWLHRSTHKWLHHSIVEEILKSMADFVLRKIISEVKKQKYFAIMLDETSDKSRFEQVCISLRYVTDELIIKEDFLGFYQTGDTQAETLFKIVKDVLLRFGLDVRNIRGQCYNGAANVSGHISGLQTRILEVSPTALFVHCVAHRLNLVVQDALTGITEIRNFLGTVQDMITFVKGSPHRLAAFDDTARIVQQELEEPDSEVEDDPEPHQEDINKSKKCTPASLLNYCPTRWCVRVKSLKRVRDNYANLMRFFDNVTNDATLDSTITSKADGYYKKMESFAFYFNLVTLISIFERIENLNEALQKHNLNISNSHSSVKITTESIAKLRSDDKFNIHWAAATTTAGTLDIEPPFVPRVRKAPKRYETQSSPHNFSSPEELYRKLYFEIIDTTLSSLKSRFDSETFDFLMKVEKFILNKGEYIQEITSFYHEDNFDGERLILHRDMLLDIRKFDNITDVINFLKQKENFYLRNLIPEIFKLVQIFLTVPVSNCTCERCFSALRRLKDYLRTSLIAQRLNNLSVLYIHDVEIDLEALINMFISKNNLRKATFQSF